MREGVGVTGTGDKDCKCLQDICILANHATYFLGPTTQSRGGRAFTFSPFPWAGD